jgi:hypothetical protein
MAGASKIVPLALTDKFDEAVNLLDMRDKHKAKHAKLQALSVIVPAVFLLLIFACMGGLFSYFKCRKRTKDYSSPTKSRSNSSPRQSRNSRSSSPKKRRPSLALSPVKMIKQRQTSVKSIDDASSKSNISSPDF